MRIKQTFTFTQSIHILLLAKAGSAIASKPSEVTWQSPSDGDLYVTGDTITGSWTTNKDISSPTVQLCQESSNNPNNTSSSAVDQSACGSTIIPQIAKNGPISSVDLAVPNITFAGAYFLAIADDSGKVYRSPTFSLVPSIQSDLGRDSLPAIAPSHTISPFLSIPASATVLPTPAKSSPPVAAIALPLSLCGALLLTALIVIFRRRSAMSSQRKPAQTDIFNSSLPSIPPHLHPMQSSVSLPTFSEEARQFSKGLSLHDPYKPTYAHTYSRNSSESGFPPPYYPDRFSSPRFRREYDNHDFRTLWDDHHDRVTRRLYRQPTWKDWFSRSDRRLSRETERDLEVDREVTWRRYLKDRDRKMEKQMEYEWYEEHERERRRKEYNKDQSLWRPVRRSGASRSSHRSGYLASRYSQASYSPTRVGAMTHTATATTSGSPSSQSHRPITPDEPEHYDTIPKFRSRTESPISIDGVVDKKPIFPSSRTYSHELYGAVERAVLNGRRPPTND